MNEPHGPLRGVKVVSCSTAQAGTVPYMLMADLGAEVIKIEAPEGGDGSRTMSILPGMPSSFFETNNRGVKSVTLNLKSKEGREILQKLVAQADIFGQNFRPGAAEKNGFGYEELRKVNRRLVYISISGYGSKGPHAHLPGTDSMAQALGGIAQAYASPGQPMRTGIASVADETCAILAFGGALAALTHARATGVGQKVELSLLGGIVRLLGWTFQTTMWRGTDPVTGQARVAGTRERPAMSASFNDRDGKPFVFQLARDHDRARLLRAGDGGRVRQSRRRHGVGRQARGDAGAARAPLCDRLARHLGGEAARRGHRVGTHQHHAGGGGRSGRGGKWLRCRDGLSQARQTPQGARHALAILRDAGQDRGRSRARRAQRGGAGRYRLQQTRHRSAARAEDHLS
jgi:crotonobetainyl-CoA:carnitine CoA-transferase CaiB-like acyl-CoA transferase